MQSPALQHVRFPCLPLPPSRLRNDKFNVRCRRSDYSGPHQPQPQPQQQQQRLSDAPPFGYPSASPQLQGGQASRVFVGYSIYKGKAALTIEPRAPEFAPLDSGAFKVSKEGFVLLQFAPAVGTRQYDWNRKQVFSLSVVEIGTLMSLGVKDSCEFFHDPFKGRSDEGKVRKVLKAEPLPDGSGRFFNLSVQNRLLNVDESIYIPISKAELAVLNSAFNFIVPHLLGWYAFTNTIKPDDSARTNNSTLQSGADLEWGR
ncbi:single-stranded DNA-binding protein WHY1, chloroplastic-like isoform X1 [Iris pallida]|uniref:Single-stranded DNA-binding protein WHY1, chloroplastic-like isoform X1 n=1 Tax=Iris pallida TaxID=29817 RepID=A0AAX6DQB3_IRIPA|nr:single-stranded DNA-binding protein WHY1, chloroplastic-like isoform X1 [Iris pallida]